MRDDSLEKHIKENICLAIQKVRVSAGSGSRKGPVRSATFRLTPYFSERQGTDWLAIANEFIEFWQRDLAVTLLPSGQVADIPTDTVHRRLVGPYPIRNEE